MDKQVEEITAKLKKANGVDEVVAICKEYGKDITPEEAQKALDLLNANDEELSLEALDEVAGGAFERLLTWIGGLFGK